MKVKCSMVDTDEHRLLLLIILVLCILIIVPLLVIAIYNRPSADDYDYAILTHQVVQNGGGFIEIIKAAWQTDINFYHSWQGLYTSAFLLALQPGIFGESFYSLTTAIILLFAFLCTLISITILNKHFLHASKLFCLTAATFVVTFISLLLPSPTQGLYWYNGAMNYMPWVFSNFLCICMLVEIYKTDSSSKAILLVAATTILSFLTSGGNHVTAFANILLLLFSLIVVWVKKKRFYPVFPLLSACIGFAIMYVAPGTAIRQAALSQQSALKTMIFATVEFFRCFGAWFSISFVLSMVLMVPVAIRFSNNNPSPAPHYFPWFPLLSSIVVICGMLCVPFYAMGDFGAGRVTNVIWITFVMSGWINYFFIFRWLYERHGIGHASSVYYSFCACKKTLKAFIVSGIIVLIILFPQNNGYSSSVYALYELKNGSAKAYGAEMDKRFETLNDDSVADVVFMELQEKSKLLYFGDVTADPTDWRNASMQEYYEKTTIKTTEADTE